MTLIGQSVALFLSLYPQSVVDSSPKTTHTPGQAHFLDIGIGQIFQKFLSPRNKTEKKKKRGNFETPRPDSKLISLIKSFLILNKIRTHYSICRITIKVGLRK